MCSTIDILLTYYDKAYQNGLSKKKERIKLQAQWNGKDTDVFVQDLLQNIPAILI